MKTNLFVKDTRSECRVVDANSDRVLLAAHFGHLDRLSGYVGRVGGRSGGVHAATRVVEVGITGLKVGCEHRFAVGAFERVRGCATEVALARVH